MSPSLWRTRNNHEDGFTLIELLVVMIIIGILAAIAVPTYLNQRKNGWRAQLKGDLRQAAEALESAAVAKADYTVSGTVANGAVLWNGSSNPSSANVEFQGTGGTSITVTKVSNLTYCITATSPSLGGASEPWVFDKAVGVPTKNGTCP